MMRKNSGTLITRWMCAAMLVTLATGLSGCAGYRLGNSLPPGIHSVCINPFANKTKEAGIESTATQKAVQEFQRDGTLKVATAAEADLILDVTLVEYVLEPIRYTGTDATKANEYRLTLRADLVLKNQKTGKTMLDKVRVSGESTFTAESDVAQAKQNALPNTSADLAHNIVEQVVEYW